MVTFAALLMFGSVWCALTQPGSRRLERVAGLDFSRQVRAHPGFIAIEDSRVRGLVCGGSGAVVGWALGDSVLAVVGLLLGVAASRWVGRLESAGITREREALTRDLPLAVDLLAACAAAGQPVDRALGVVAQAIGGPLAQRLQAPLARLRLGADPVTEWGALTGDDQLGALARTMTRSLQSGAPLANGLSRLAEDSRRESRTLSQARARSVGVKAAGPLAVCFLPAFMLIGVVPTIAGAFSSLVR